MNYLEQAGEGRYLPALLERFRDVPVSTIGQREIDDAARALKPGCKPATINRHIYTPMMAVLHHAASRGDCEYIRIRRPKVAEPETRWLTPDEAGTLIANCNDRLRPLVVFLIYTGCRISEAVGLTWGDIDLGRRTAFVAKTKGGKPRTMHLPEPVVMELADETKREDKVFAYASRHSIRTAWRTATKHAGLKGLRPHDLRHTYATWLRQYAKLDLKGIMDAGGWASVTSVVRYAHTAPSEAAEAADRLPVVKNR